jgi:hypothetical protein
MSNKVNRFNLMRALPVGLAILAATLLVTSERLPLWHMRLEAPQYRDEEALKVTVFPSKFGGDLREISVLNQYIGVHVPPRLPQFGWLPMLLFGGAALGVGASLLGFRVRRIALGLTCVILASAVLAAAVQARTQMHDIGHKRDHRTILAGIHDFTPPLFGTSKIAQFTVTSRLGLGAWLIGGAIILQASGAWLSRKSSFPFTNRRPVADAPATVSASQFAYQI